jgi:hypothetical protein
VSLAERLAIVPETGEATCTLASVAFAAWPPQPAITRLPWSVKRAAAAATKRLPRLPSPEVPPCRQEPVD